MTDLSLIIGFETTLYYGYIDDPLRQSLERLIEQIPNQSNIFDWYDEDSEWWEKDENVEWWKANCKAWNEQWSSLLIEHRNIGHKWEFTDKQIELLQNYYNGNEILVDCLNSSGIISHRVRQEIEETLLLPKDELQKYKEKHRLSSV